MPIYHTYIPIHMFPYFLDFKKSKTEVKEALRISHFPATLYDLTSMPQWHRYASAGQLVKIMSLVLLFLQRLRKLERLPLSVQMGLYPHNLQFQICSFNAVFTSEIFGPFSGPKPTQHSRTPQACGVTAGQQSL